MEHHKRETVDFLLRVWFDNVQDTMEGRGSEKNDETLLRMIEVLVWMKCPANFIVDALLESNLMSGIRLAGERKPVMPKGLLHLDEALTRQ